MESSTEIMVVDDTPANLEVISETLSSAGYRVAAAISGERALKRLHTHPPALILLDIQMPVMDGFEVCRQIKANAATANIPIIFITARSDTQSILHGFEMGAVDYISKPFQEAELLARVRTHLQLCHVSQLYDVEREKAEQLQQLNQQLSLTQFSVDHSVDGILWFNPDSSIAYANGAICELLGYALEELLQLSSADLKATGHHSEWNDFQQKVREQHRLRFEAQLLTKGGQELPVEIALNYLQFSSREYYVVHCRDIRDRKAAEAKLRQLNTELDQRVQDRTQELSHTLETLKSAQASLVESEKMAALGALVAGVAHEINTPIGNTITVASTLADESAVFVNAAEAGQLKRSTLNHYLDVVNRCTKLINSNLGRAGDLIQSFKQVAVDQSHRELRTFNLKDYVGEVVTSLEPQARRSGLTLDLAGDDSIVLTHDPGVFAQVITNLVTNSIKHAYQPGEVGQLQIHLEQQNDQVLLTYRDDGCGISTENLSRVYEPFFTTARNQGGTGLGLNIVYNIVTQSLKGTIKIDSQLGQGTTFTVALPYAS
ncbi:hybrid sensor histidine kinase/response regulator [Acaryochloris marina]|uniref:histidine kinase n=1 Tax=Acaryochloris marina (strain MBIC 11017) TaxID=329726 RepID=B0C795_ACAM1|nr:response regulator [Acaryochloris marina]ABW30072.1 PAS/PAC sensor signal transduction histidine kinase [Acaryochloris marina MBIC11017]